MKKEEVISKKASPAVGPYSQAVKFQNLVYCAGQIGKDPKTNKLVEGIKKQTQQVLTNLKYVLEAANSDINNILKTTVYLADMDDYPVMNEVYETFFKKPFPARATVQVTKLPIGSLVEIECIAFINEPTDAEAMAGKEDNCCGGGCGGNC